MENIKCMLCGGSNCKLIQTITKKPKEETDFKIKNYYREIYFCNDCGVYFNLHDYDLESIYSGEYNEATYKNKINEKYQKIMQIPFEASDNKHRVDRIFNFAKAKSFNPEEIHILDIGSGLCVFLGELKKKGFKCYCIDPDPISIAHAKENVKIDAYCGTLDNFESDLTFDIITFNKVLEHIKNPIRVLKEAKKYLKPEGIIYIELPDGENAIKNLTPIERREFCIEHYFIFNKDSFTYLLENAGLIPLKLQEIHEPSGKYTIFAFAKIK